MRGCPLEARLTILTVWAPAAGHSEANASTRLRAVDDPVPTVAASTPSTNTLAEPWAASSSVTQAIARHAAQWNVADAEAAAVYLATPPHAPAKLDVCQVPAYVAAPSWKPASATLVVELAPPQSTATVYAGPTRRLSVAPSAVP